MNWQHTQEQGVGRDGMWDGVLKHAFFATQHNKNASLDHLYNLFTHRHAALWKVLERAMCIVCTLRNVCYASMRLCHCRGWAVVRIPHISSPFCVKTSPLCANFSHHNKAGHVQEWLRRIANEATRSDATAFGCTAADWAAMVEQVYPPTDTTNVYKHLRLADFTDNVAALPPEARLQAMQGAGMMGVAEQAGEAEAVLQQLQAVEQQLLGTRVELTNEQLRGTNPLVAFLQSLLPWVAVREGEGEGDGDGGGDGGGDDELPHD